MQLQSMRNSIDLICHMTQGWYNPGRMETMCLLHSINAEDFHTCLPISMFRNKPEAQCVKFTQRRCYWIRQLHKLNDFDLDKMFKTVYRHGCIRAWHIKYATCLYTCKLRVEVYSMICSISQKKILECIPLTIKPCGITWWHGNGDIQIKFDKKV